MQKRRLLWCDAEANWGTLCTSKDVSRIVEKAKRFGIDSLLVDVKPLSGEVLYDSDIAPRFVRHQAGQPSQFDLLDAMLSEAHKRGVEVHAAINVFSEGSRQRGVGPAFQHTEWQAVTYESVRTVTIRGKSWKVEWVDPVALPEDSAFYTRKYGETVQSVARRQYVSISGESVIGVCRSSGESIKVPQDGGVLSLPEGVSFECREGDGVLWNSEAVFRRSQDSRLPSYGLFVNPTGPAREYELRIIHEIVANYAVDGIVLDRMRYPNLYADFGSDSRRQFESWLGKGELVWPTDIFTISHKPWEPPNPGRYYKEWLEWRARQITEFATEACALVRRVNPAVKVGTYVGSWYDSYYVEGVNWGSRNTPVRYNWMTPCYHETGYAELFDYICTGCYYPVVTRDEARESGRPVSSTVEAACDLSMEVVNGACPVYGSLYLLDYQGRAEAFCAASEIVMSRTDGIMLFDLVYLEDYDWWQLLE